MSAGQWNVQACQADGGGGLRSRDGDGNAKEFFCPTDVQPTEASQLLLKKKKYYITGLIILIVNYG